MYDCIVIGCGGVGSFALRALKQRGISCILGIERFAHLHDKGSSHGSSRIYRKAYFEHANYVPWIQYSEQVFGELSSDDLVEQCGTLMMEEPGGLVIASCAQTALEHDISVERLSNQELRERYPQFQLYSNSTIGLLEPGGGFLRPERAMKAALKDSQAKVWQHTVVQSLTEHHDHVELIVQQKNNNEMVLQSKAVIVSAGAWTSQLIPIWKSFLTPTRQLQGWIDARTLSDDVTLYQPSKLPTWYMSTPASSLPLYGIPADPACSSNPTWTKVAMHLRQDPVANPSHCPSTIDPLEQDELDTAAHSSLVIVPTTSPYAESKPCLYTMTPDQHFLVGQPAGAKRIVAAAGLSGHGFKMTPALGEMLVDMVVEGQDAAVTKWKSNFISPKRFGV